MYNTEKLLELLEYNFWANDLFIVRLQEHSEIPAEIERLMSHILSAHSIWLGRISKKEELPSVWDNVAQDEWESKNIGLYHEACDIVKSNSIEKRVFYTSTKGTHYDNTLGDLIYHLINHSTHHRAQIAILMRQHQILPPQSDYIFYLRKN